MVVVFTLGGESSCLECIFHFFSLKVSQLIEKYEICDSVGVTPIWPKKKVMLEAKIADVWKEHQQYIRKPLQVFRQWLHVIRLSI